MSSNSESGFSFPAPKPRSSSERARQDAIARGRKRRPNGDLFGSISDLGDAGKLEDLDPTVQKQRPSSESGPLPELELDGIPSGFFRAVDDIEADEPFALPTGVEAATAPPSEVKPAPKKAAPPVADEEDEKLQLVGIPSGFFNSVDDDRGLDLPDDGPEAPADYEVEAAEDLNDESGFSFDLDLPSCLGEQPSVEATAILEKTRRGQSDGHMTIPPNAGAIARPSADTGLVQRVDRSAPTRQASRPSRISGSHASTRAALQSHEPLRDAEPGVMVFPSIPTKAAHSADSVPPMLFNAEPASPTRNRGFSSGSYREIGRSPRPTSGDAATAKLDPKDIALAAIRRQTSGSRSVVQESTEMKPFRARDPEPDDRANLRGEPTAPVVNVDDAKLRAEPIDYDDAPDFDEFDYGGISGSGEVSTRNGSTSLGVNSVAGEELAGDLTQPPSAMLAAQRLRAQSAGIQLAPERTSISAAVDAASQTAIPTLLQRADSTSEAAPVSVPLPARRKPEPAGDAMPELRHPEPSRSRSLSRSLSCSDIDASDVLSSESIAPPAPPSGSANPMNDVANMADDATAILPIMPDAVPRRSAKSEVETATAEPAHSLAGPPVPHPQDDLPADSTQKRSPAPRDSVSQRLGADEVAAAEAPSESPDDSAAIPFPAQNLTAPVQAVESRGLSLTAPVEAAPVEDDSPETDESQLSEAAGRPVSASSKRRSESIELDLDKVPLASSWDDEEEAAPVKTALPARTPDLRPSLSDPTPPAEAAALSETKQDTPPADAKPEAKAETKPDAAEAKPEAKAKPAEPKAPAPFGSGPAPKVNSGSPARRKFRRIGPSARQ